jgi:hypothetical protein
VEQAQAKRQCQTISRENAHPGQCKTISNGLFRPKTQKQPEQVWASDLQLKNAMDQKVGKPETP